MANLATYVRPRVFPLFQNHLSAFRLPWLPFFSHVLAFDARSNARGRSHVMNILVGPIARAFSSACFHVCSFPVRKSCCVLQTLGGWFFDSLNQTFVFLNACLRFRVRSNWFYLHGFILNCVIELLWGKILIAIHGVRIEHSMPCNLSNFPQVHSRE